MIITFDGHSSVGKTTQAKILSEKLGIPDVNVNSEFTVVERFFRVANSSSHARPLAHVLQGLTTVMSMREKWGPDFILADHFLRLLMPAWRQDMLDEVFDVFRGILTCCGGEEPVASFFLYMSGADRINRLLKREAANRKYTINEVDISVEGDIDEPFLEMCQYLSPKVPYLHIIDANQDCEQVTDDILKVLRNRGLP